MILFGAIATTKELEIRLIVAFGLQEGKQGAIRRRRAFERVLNYSRQAA